MAHIHPAGWREMAVTGAAVREIETLACLDASVAHAPYSIYHGVHWTNVKKRLFGVRRDRLHHRRAKRAGAADRAKVRFFERDAGRPGQELSRQGEERAHHDLFGNPVFRDGALLAESVYRFKGQSAPAVIFTEVDFAAIDALVFRKLFVGMTRARLKLVLVLSERAAAQLLERM